LPGHTGASPLLPDALEEESITSVNALERLSVSEGGGGGGGEEEEEG